MQKRAQKIVPLKLKKNVTKVLVLSSAVSNDARFLSSHSIIDYSLLVGIDAEKDDLVVGMIDFIRTYTWDKKWEYEIKTHFTPGSTPPTILHPV